MLQQFKSMNDLVTYLGALEERIKTLETENEKLRALPSTSENMDRNVIAGYISHYLPQTNLVSANFFKRAFAVWGHFFVANLIVGIIFGVLYACLAMVLFGSILGNISQSP